MGGGGERRSRAGCSTGKPDFSDALLLGASPTGTFVDNSPLPKAFYSVLCGG